MLVEHFLRGGRDPRTMLLLANQAECLVARRLVVAQRRRGKETFYRPTREGLRLVLVSQVLGSRRDRWPSLHGERYLRWLVAKGNHPPFNAQPTVLQGLISRGLVAPDGYAPTELGRQLCAALDRVDAAAASFGGRP